MTDTDFDFISLASPKDVPSLLEISKVSIVRYSEEKTRGLHTDLKKLYMQKCLWCASKQHLHRGKQICNVLSQHVALSNHVCIS